jgi:sodium transport system permease protein
MRWSIVRLIWLRELRDQLRDRRTMLMIAVLPVVLYPVLGMAVVHFAVGFSDKPSVVGIAGSDQLPACKPTSAGLNPLPAVGWLSALALCPLPPGPPLDRVLAASVLFNTSQAVQEYPPLLVNGRFPSAYSAAPPSFRVSPAPRDEEPENGPLRVQLLPDDGREALDRKEIDVLLQVPAGFAQALEQEGRPVLQLAYREDDRSRLASQRLYGVLGAWRHDLRQVRLLRRGLAPAYDDPVEIRDLQKEKSSDEVVAESLLDLLVRIFPFLLVMWSLAGALYPAVDLCAGEKERGTMETLLISPASREEIVWGKFLTIWVFSAATALLNLASMGMTASQFSGVLTHEVLRPGAVFWCVLLALPLSAFFSAISLAIGAYARSSKEGQYYLMPLFIVTMPLVFLSLAPGVELNPFYSLVPVTGVALLLQRLMTSSLDQVPWLYFVPVLAPVVLYSGLALQWAIEQFKREEVLFREAERLEIRLWLRRLFRDKDALPSAGQAIFCFALVIALRWLTMGFDPHVSLVARTAVTYLACVAAPPMLMALLLTTRPRLGFALHVPSPWSLVAAGILSVLLLPPLAELTLAILRRFPTLVELMRQRQPLVHELEGLRGGSAASWWLHLLVFGLMPAVFEELAFRGFILSGLRRRLGPGSAILLSSCLFALYHMNVFQLLPAFLLGTVLALLALWSGSILPGMLFHCLYNGMLISVALLPRLGYVDERISLEGIFNPSLTLAFTLLALAFLLSLARNVLSSPGARTVG